MNISDCNIHNLQFLPMAAKNETHVLILTLVITIGTIGAGLWWFTHNSGINLSQLGVSKPDSNNFHQQPGAVKEQSNASRSQESSTRGLDYTDLSHDLQAHNWKQANIDTTEDLLKAFGSNSQRTGHVDPQEAANPPCQDLKIVDQLWSKASNGNLGFTVQRQILQQAGNNYHQAYNQMQWQRPGGEWLIQYIYDGHRENFKPGYEPDYGNPDRRKAEGRGQKAEGKNLFSLCHSGHKPLNLFMKNKKDVFRDAQRKKYDVLFKSPKIYLWGFLLPSASCLLPS